MEVSAEHLGGAQFLISARGHQVVSDQPLDNGGTDTGMSPPEFLLVSLASCGAYYATRYLFARGLSAEGLKFHVSAEKVSQPARLDKFRIDLSAPGLDSKHEEGLVRAVKACLIHNTLLNHPSIEITVNAESLANV